MRGRRTTEDKSSADDQRGHLAYITLDPDEVSTPGEAVPCAHCGRALRYGSRAVHDELTGQCYCNWEHAEADPAALSHMTYEESYSMSKDSPFAAGPLSVSGRTAERCLIDSVRASRVGRKFLEGEYSLQGVQSWTEADDFTRAYLEALMWTAPGDDEHETLDAFTFDDISPEALQKAMADCKKFQEDNAELLETAYDTPGYDEAQAGHDFALTRNGHGTGFWDREFDDPNVSTPQDEDYMMSDSGHLGSRTSVGIIGGAFVGEFASEDEALERIQELMDSDQFWPNVWYQDDHGGINGPVDVKTGEYIKQEASDIGDKLTAAADTFGEADLYLGDDGMIYAESSTVLRRVRESRGWFSPGDDPARLFGGVVILGITDDSDFEIVLDGDEVYVGIIHDGGGYTPAGWVAVSQGFFSEDEMVQAAWEDFQDHKTDKMSPEEREELEADAAELGMDSYEYLTDAWDGVAATLSPQEFKSCVDAETERWQNIEGGTPLSAFTFVEGEVDESRRVESSTLGDEVNSVTHCDQTTKVYHNADTGVYTCHLHRDGEHVPAADFVTKDEGEATRMADIMARTRDSMETRRVQTSEDRRHIHAGYDIDFDLIEDYKGKEIGYQNGDTVAVYDPDEQTVFIVGLDDSKSGGSRKFVDEANTVEAAREYIDWLTRARESRRAESRVIEDRSGRVEIYPDWFKANLPRMSHYVTVWEIGEELYYIGEGESDATTFVQAGNIVYCVSESTRMGYRGLALINLGDDDYERVTDSGGSDLEAGTEVNLVPMEHSILLQGDDYTEVEDLSVEDFINRYSQVFESQSVMEGLASVSKNDVRKLIRKMESSSEMYPGDWTSRQEFNGRGDYGYNETFYLNGKPMLQISVDGARQEPRFAADTEAFAELEQAAKSEKSTRARKVAELRIKYRDREVIQAFVDQQAAESPKLNTDGQVLDGLWMGGNGIAQWVDGKIHVSDLGSRSADTVIRELVKTAPKNDFDSEAQQLYF